MALFDAIAQARLAGDPQQIWKAVLSMLEGADAKARAEAWDQHFVGLFADQQAVGFSANALWEIPRRACSDRRPVGWLANIDFDQLVTWAREAAESSSREQAEQLARAHSHLLRAAAARLEHGEASPEFFNRLFDSVARWISFLDPETSVSAFKLGASVPPANLAQAIDRLWQGGRQSIPPEILLPALAIAEHALCWMAGENVPEVDGQHTTIALAHGSGQGTWAHLHVERRPRPAWLDADLTVFYPDPVWLGMCVLDPAWLASFAAAAQYAGRGLGAISWRLEFPPLRDQANAAKSWQHRSGLLAGGSAGAAAACALVALRDGTPLDPSVCITADLRRDGTLGPVSGRMTKLLGLPGPAEIRRLLTVEPSSWLLQAGQARGIDVVAVRTLNEAQHWMSGRLQLVRSFLSTLSVEGLKQAIVFRPEHVTPDELYEFCLPPRVIEEQTWQRVASGHEDTSEQDSDESYVSAERLCHADDPRAMPRSLDRVACFGKGHAILRGEPGEGKSTALHWTVARECRQMLADLGAGSIGIDAPGLRVPLVLRLGEVDEAFVGSCALPQMALMRTLELVYGTGPPPGQLLAWLQEKIGAGQYSLWLDALDEATPAVQQWLRRELGRECQTSVLLTTRLTADDHGLLAMPRRYRIAGLDDSQVNRFISRHFASDERKHRDLMDRFLSSPAMRRLARLPLMLAALCQRASRSGVAQLPRTRAQFLSQALEHFSVRGDEQRSQSPRPARNQAKHWILGHVAKSSVDGPIWSFTRNAFLETVQPLLDRSLGDHAVHRPYRPGASANSLPMEADELLTEFLADGLLVPCGDGYRFVLRSLHEYCLAGWIARAGREVSDLGRLDERAVWPLMAAQLNREEATQLVKDLWQQHERREDLLLSRLRLAARCVGQTGVRDEVVEQIVSALDRAIKDEQAPDALRRACIDALAETKHAGTLLQLAQDDRLPWPLRAACVKAVAHSGEQMMLDPLRALVADRGQRQPLRIAGLQALKELGDSQLASFCRAVVAHREDTIDEFQNACAEMLGHFRDSQTMHDLEQWLSDEDFDLPLPCIRALGQLATDRAFETLARVLQDSNADTHVRSACVTPLTQAGPQIAGKLLADVLEDPAGDMVLRAKAASALGAMGDLAAGVLLCQHLADDRNPIVVRHACAMALADLRVTEVLPTLGAILADRNDAARVRGQCATALGELGDDSQAPLMRQLLLDVDAPEIVRCDCAIALGQLQHTESIPLLRDLLHSDQHGIRAACAQSLGLMQDAGSSEALLRALRDTESSSPLRITCVQVLGRLSTSSAEACQVLIERMQDCQEGASFRQACAKVLSRIPRPEAREAILAGHLSSQLANSWSLLETIYRTQGHRPFVDGWADR